MKLNVNKNILWSKIFIDQLTSLGVRYACISPGSRSTPLTYVISQNKKIKSYVHLDERSSAFFGLGIAKANGSPTLIVTTSGTAVAELYPAIIEAYQQRVPLIICTADRPPELIGTGANQTINQKNIFSNHIRWFRDLGLPSVSEKGLLHLRRLTIKAFDICLTKDRGPVHLNFPFRKPLEPFNYTDEISKRILSFQPQKVVNGKSELRPRLTSATAKSIDELIKFERGIILVGPMDYDFEFIKNIKRISRLLKYPIIADGLSHLRFGISKKEKMILSNFNSILKSDNFIQSHDPEIIIQSGRTPTSSELEIFLSKTSAKRYLINSYGDNFDPTRNAYAILLMSEKNYSKILLEHLKRKKFNRQPTSWFTDFLKAESVSQKTKVKIIESNKNINEPSLMTEIFKCLPVGIKIFIGNSLPVRDLDNFVGTTSKKLNVHFNRGASGIDGITSTALGIASSKQKTILITGDLSFLHDLTALSIGAKYSFPLTILVINNNGGGIFHSLPIANKVNYFNEFFITPHNLKISSLVKSFGIEYQKINTKTGLQDFLDKILNKNRTSVLEIQTDSMRSLQLRNKYFSEVSKKLNKEFSE